MLCEPDTADPLFRHAGRSALVDESTDVLEWRQRRKEEHEDDCRGI